MRFTRASRTAAAGLSALAALLASTTAHAAPAPHLPRHAPGDTITLPVRDALQALTVQDEGRTGYERSKFKHWTDADKDSCNSRAEVLIAEAVTAPAIGPNCTLTGGNWYSAYDDQYLDSAKKLDVDHLVPLAEAWDSGASAWSPKEREAYANDLDDSRDLIAVSAASNRNRSKGDKDPSDWMPPYAGYWCQYLTDWVADKTRWDLSIDPTEQATLTEGLSRCPDQPIHVTLAR
ncbi:HNH endonuclease [Streptomyces sp. S1A1-7]|uniref:HNH endonuclease family protein n=1 Tax=unclassified Streptomyces TaxID=2593676 RepID=UPI0011659560|nr:MULTISPECIES: HNH endonuclease family protein [unclassified Streptomyces]QDN74660.1 HNH endonuclease [Streptomyces sp. S1A1-7]QDN93347.1 HNH endonuclease [Streptomyces sp. RLB3-6]